MYRRITCLFVLSLILFLGVPEAEARCRTTSKVIVKGNKASWTKIGKVPANHVLKVRASGIVNFGGWGQKDSPEAGVTGLWQSLKDLYKIISRVSKFIGCINGNPISCVSLFLDFAKRSAPVKYNQGGVWIRVLYTPRNIKEAMGGAKKAMATNLYFYWVKIWNKLRGGVRFAKSVTIWAMAHDGGKSPTRFKRRDYRDNKGKYKVWLKICPKGSSVVRIR